MQKTVIIDFERLKYPNTGLFHFCFHLGKNLSNLAANPDKLFFYVPKYYDGCFGKHVNYVRQKTFHKYYFPGISKYNIWHASQQGTEYFPFSSNQKKILTIHDINFMHDGSKSIEKKKKYLSDLEKKISHSDRIVAISNYVMADVLKHVDIPEIKRSIIYNGCNIEEMKELHLPKIKPEGSYLYTIGVITAKKNFHVLPPLLIGNSMKLVISGITDNTGYKQKIVEEAKRFGVEKRLIFTGAVSENDKQWYLSNCTAFVFPSLAEGFGLPVIEAMYFGKPVILSTLTSLPEIGGDAAYYFNSFEPENMADVLKTSLESFQNNKPENLIKQRAQSFNWRDTAQKYLSLYDSVIGQ